MDGLIVQSNFAAKLYQWALKKACEEALADFPLIKKVKSRRTQVFLETLQQYSKQQQLDVVEACVKLRHQKALVTVDENISNELRLTVENFRKDSRKLFDLRYRRNKISYISKELLSSLFVEQLSLTLGNVEQIGFFTWIYKTPVGKYILETTVSCDEGEVQLSYYQRITYAADATFILLEQTNILDCLGMVMPSWDLLTNSELGTAANNLNSLCNEFLRALESLTSDLPDINSNHRMRSIVKQRTVELNQVFDLRLYQWAKLDYQREVKHDFEFLSQIRGSIALRNLAILRSLSQTEALELLNTLIKRTISYQSFVASMDVWSDADQERYEGYRQRFYGTPNLSEVENEILIMASFGQISLKINKRNLKSLLKQKLRDTIGNVIENNGSVMIFRLPMGKYDLYTEIDIGGYYQIRYRHWFSLDSDSRCIGSHRDLSLMGWMGLGETAWNLLTEEDVYVAVGALQHFCTHFVNATSSMLVDL